MDPQVLHHEVGELNSARRVWNRYSPRAGTLGLCLPSVLPGTPSPSLHSSPGALSKWKYHSVLATTMLTSAYAITSPAQERVPMMEGTKASCILTRDASYCALSAEDGDRKRAATKENGYGKYS